MLVRSSLMVLTFTALVINVSAKAEAQFGGLFGPRVETIDTETLAKMLSNQRKAESSARQSGAETPEADFVVVDVRSDAEVKVSVIPGAITKAEFERNRDKFADRLVIPYCTVGGRSAAYAKQLVKAGLDVKNYKGSILEWVGADLPLVTLDGQPTNRVHTYSDRYDVPAKYEQVTR